MYIDTFGFAKMYVCCVPRRAIAVCTSAVPYVGKAPDILSMYSILSFFYKSCQLVTKTVTIQKRMSFCVQ